MSFEISGVPHYSPKVDGAMFNKDGGGGNTGYFEQRKPEEELHEQDGEDKLELSTTKIISDELDIDFTDTTLLKILNFIKTNFNAFIAMFKNLRKNAPNKKLDDSFVKSSK